MSFFYLDINTYICSQIQTMKSKVTRNKVKLILKWCESEFGKSEYTDKELRFRLYNSFGSSYSPDGLCGCYFDRSNTINIFLKAHNNWRELCRTIIHEYTHYMLSSKNYDRIYKKMIKAGYSDSDLLLEHPHEIVCNMAEDLCTDICYDELKNKLYKK